MTARITLWTGEYFPCPSRNRVRKTEYDCGFQSASSCPYLLGDPCRCAVNTAVQIVAVLPGTNLFLQRVCYSDSELLPLHTALQEQLEELSSAHENHRVTSVEKFLEALDSVPAVSALVVRFPAR